MYFVGSAVRNCQIAARLYLDYAEAAGHFQYITVQIQRHSAVNCQSTADFNITLQCDPGNTAICQCSRQFFGWLAGLGAAVRIESPESVVREYREYLETILKTYGEQEL